MLAKNLPPPPAPLQDQMLIVMGLPRSGTTWLAKIFDSHPETFYSHEPDTRRFHDVPLLLPREGADIYREAMIREVRAFRSLRSLRVVAKLPLFAKRYQLLPSVRARTVALATLKIASRVAGSETVPRLISGSPDDASLWVWKSIESSGRLGALIRAFPGARVVFIVRHPCGVAASLLRGEASAKFSAGPASADHGFFELLSATEEARSRGLTFEAFRTMSSIERIAWRWALLNEKAMAEAVGSEQCRLLRYEDLCTKPAAVARDLFAFAGLQWNNQTEEFISASTSHGRSDYYSVFKNPQDSAFRWRKELPAEIARTILSTVGDTPPGRLYDED
jgi:hypothetical protein